MFKLFHFPSTLVGPSILRGLRYYITVWAFRELNYKVGSIKQLLVFVSI